MENGLSGCGKWMDVESGKWRGSGSHTSIQLQSDSGVDRSYNEVENVIAVVCWEICRLGSVDRR